MLPEGFEARMRALLGSEYEDFLASFDRPLCTGLRRNPLKTGFTGDLSRFSLSPVPWCPTGFYYDAVSRPGLSPYHAAGLYYLQEPSAMAPAELLDPQPGGGHERHLRQPPAGDSDLRRSHAPPRRAAGLLHVHVLSCGKRGRDLGLFVEKSRFFCRKAGRAVLFSRQTRLGSESRAGIGKNVPPLAA